MSPDYSVTFRAASILDQIGTYNVSMKPEGRKNPYDDESGML